MVLLVRTPRSFAGEAIAVVGLGDAARGCQHGEPFIERGGTDATAGAQLGERQRTIGGGEGGRDALVE